MSVKVLAADESLGYWSFEVTNSKRGTFTVELSRGKKVDPAEAVLQDDYDKYEAFVSVTHDGVKVFRAHEDYDLSASLMPHEGNGLVVSASLGCLAEWGDETKRFNRFRDATDELFGERGKIVAPGFDPLPDGMLDILDRWDEALYVVAGQLYLHGMDNTDLKWRDEFVGHDEVIDVGDEAREEYAR